MGSRMHCQDFITNPNTGVEPTTLHRDGGLGADGVVVFDKVDSAANLAALYLSQWLAMVELVGISQMPISVTDEMLRCGYICEFRHALM